MYFTGTLTFLNFFKSFQIISFFKKLKISIAVISEVKESNAWLKYKPILKVL